MSDDAERSDAGEGTDDEGMHAAVAEFLAGANDVYGEYDRGYVDADAALSVLSSRIDDLRDAADAHAADAGGSEGGDDGGD